MKHLVFFRLKAVLVFVLLASLAERGLAQFCPGPVISPSIVEFSAEGGTEQVTINRVGQSCSWYLDNTNTASWARASYPFVTQNTIVTIEADPNLTTSLRITKIKVIADFTIKEIEIRQGPCIPSTAPVLLLGPAGEVAPGFDANLSISGGTHGTSAEYEWFAGGCGVNKIPNASGSSITVRPTSTTTYFVRRKGLCGTTTCIQRQVQVCTLPTVNFTTQSNKYEFCLDDGPEPLIGTPAGPPGAIIGGGSFTGSGVSDNTFNPAVAGVGEHDITYTYPFGFACANSITKTIKVNGLPNATITPTGPVTLCQGSSEVLTASGGGSYSWSTNVSSQSITVNTPGTYTVTVTDNNSCSSTASVTVVLADPQENFVVTVDNFFTVDGQTNPNPIPGGVEYEVTLNGPFSPITLDAHHFNNHSGTISVPGRPTSVDIWYFFRNGSITCQNTMPIDFGAFSRITRQLPRDDLSCADANALASYAFLRVDVSFVEEVATLSADGPTDFCQGGDVTLNVAPTGAGFSYTWFKNGESISGATGPGLVVNTAGNYQALVKRNSADCGLLSNEIQVTVKSRPNATINSAGPFCLNDPAENLSAATGGGTWSGPGIIDATLGRFDPSVAGVGTHTITYQVTGANQCVGTDTETITVRSLPDATITPAGPFCANDPAENLTATTGGGTWSGPGITDPVNGIFDPSVAGVGTHTITYQVTGTNGCTNTDTENIVVNPLPDATITPEDPFCLNAAAKNLTAATSGGTWSGPGITGTVNGTFDPSVAGVGTHTITYQVTDANNCTGIDTEDIIVNALADATITPEDPFCIDDESKNLTAATGGGTWSGTGITNATLGTFNPGLAGVGDHIITYTINSGSCSDSDTETIIVRPKPVIEATPNPENIENGQTTDILLSSNLTSTTYTWNVVGLSNVTAGPSNGAGANVAVPFTLINGAVPGSAAIVATGSKDGCASDPLSIPVNVAVVPPADPVPDPGLACFNNPAKLTATTTTGTLHWYDVPGGGTLLGTGSPFTTPGPITANTSFWVEAFEDGLSSNRIEVPVTVINPAVITINETVGTTCDAPDGFISFQYTGNAATYNYRIKPVGSQSSVFDGKRAPGTIVEFSSLAVGSYVLQVEPDVEGCLTETPFTIIDEAPTFDICAASISCTAPADGSVNSQIEITVSRQAPTNTGTFNYHIEDHVGNTVVSGTGSFGQQISSPQPQLAYTGNDYKFVLELGADNNCVTAPRTIRIRRAAYTVSTDRADGIYEVCEELPNVVLTANLNTFLCPVTGNQHHFLVTREGTPPTVIHNGPVAGNVLTLNNVALGNYQVTATSTDGGFEICTATTSFVVRQNSLAVEVFTTDPSCHDPQNLNPDGRAIASVTGGTPPYKYEWFAGIGIDPDTAPPISILSTAIGLSPGGYTVKVTDSKCDVSDTTSFTLNQPPPVGNISAIQPAASCEVSAQLTGADVSRGPFTFFWILLEERTRPDIVEGVDGQGNPTYDFQDITETIENIVYVENVTPAANGDIISTVSTLVVPSGNYIIRAEDNFGCSTESNHTIQTPVDTRPPYQLCFRWTTGPLIPPSQPQPSPQVTLVSLQAQDIINGLEDQVERCVANRMAELDASIDQNCSDPERVNDELLFNYKVGQYHYTLYYFDRGGNLLKTIPPEGVTVDAARDRTTVVAHNLPSTYEYNSLGQLVSQNSPDGGTTNFVYNDLGQLRFSQNAKQADLTDDGETFSYTKYDVLGRIIEVGESQLGVSYTAPGGATYAASTFSDLLNEQIANLDKEFYGSGQDGNLLYPDRDEVYPTPAQTLSEQTRTYYTASTSLADYFGKPQTYLRNRVSYVETFNLNGERAATYYSYDPHGNVKWLIQDIPGLRKNYLAYDYDLISGNVLKVRYNEGLNDAFYHRYAYDEDNRLLAAYTSPNNQLWDRDAGYEYYQHGPLKRTVIGQDRVQGVDYTYTVHGWLKAVNHPDVANTDPGNDGDINQTGKDAFGMALGYYSGDFSSNGSPFNNTHASHLSGTDLFNGNISSWTTGTFAPGDPNATNGYLAMSGRTFGYDKLNRIKTSTFNTFSSNWIPDPNQAFANKYSYDGNGNLDSLQRRDAQGTLIDNLTYHYNITQNNRLDHVTDQVADGANNEDIDGQLAGNYSYDAIGNLVGDVQEDITRIDWTVYGKVSEITKNIGGQDRITRFQYDAAGNRVKKSHEDTNGNITNTYYVRDASGNVMAIYDDVREDFTGGYDIVYKLREQPIFGSGRLGQRNADYEVSRMRYEGTLPPVEVLTGLEFDASLNNWLLPVTSAEGSALARLDMTNAPVLSSVTAPLGRGDLRQVAVAEDATGNLMFSLAVAPGLHGAEGEVVVILDKDGHLMPGTATINTGKLKADPSGQSLIARTLEDGMKYKIFTIGRDHKAYVHTVDMSIIGTGRPADPNGEVISKNEPLDNTFDFVQAMTLMEDRQFECPVIHLYLMGYDPTAPAGGATTMSLRHYAIAGATVSSNTLDSWEGYNSYGQLQLSKDGTRLAAATPQGQPLGWYNATNQGAELRVYDINILENVVSNAKLIDLGDDVAVNSIDYSADNDFVYYTTSGPASGHKVDRVDVASQSATPENLATLTNYAQLRRGNNDNLYLTEANGRQLMQIVHDVTTPVISSVDLSLDAAYSLTGVMPAQPLSLSQMGAVPDTFTRELGKYYELKDHLGNVRVVVSDKLGTEISGGNIINFSADFISYTDYYPFGTQMPGRSLNAGDYRYGFNGKEKDQSGEFGLTAYDYGFRIYNPALGKFLSVDPLTDQYAFYSPYHFAGNDPILFVDLDGREPTKAPLYWKQSPAMKKHSRNGVIFNYTEGLGGNGKFGESLFVKTVVNSETGAKSFFFYNDVKKLWVPFGIEDVTGDPEEITNFAVGTIAATGSVVSGAVLAESGVVGWLLTEVVEGIVEEITGIWYVPIRIDPTDIFDPLINQTAKELLGEGAERVARKGLKPTEINFSQRTVSGNVEKYTADMKAGKWDWNKSGPIRIMKQDGKWVSYDNRRLMAAQNAGLDNIPYRVVNPNAIMPGSKKTWAEAFQKRFDDVRNVEAGGAVPRGGLSSQPTIKK